MRIPTILASALLCVAGPAQDQEAKARAESLVRAAVAYAQAHGKEALARETNHGTGRFHVRNGNDFYIFIYDMKGVCQAIGFQSQLVGVNRISLRDPANGTFIVQEMIRVARDAGSGWVDYHYPNPATGRVELKHSYVEHLDGWVIGCGYYQQVSPARRSGAGGAPTRLPAGTP